MLSLPAVEVVNRFGLSFGRSRKTTTYAGSGRKFRSYYSLVCLRCGWAFKSPRHRSHRMEDCDLVLAQLADPATLAFVHENLFGKRPTRRRRRRAR